MSNSTASRPRPKPKRLTTPKLTPPQAPSSAAAGISTTAAQRQRELDEEDALFLRNKSRPAQYWKRLAKANKEIDPRPSLNSSDEEGSGSSPRSHKQKKRPNNVSNWTKTKDIVRLLSEDVDDDVLEVEDDDERRTDWSPSKRKRVQSRSRSITPPPALPIQSLQNARNLVRRTLDPPRRPDSPTLIEEHDSTDTIVLDPELAQIAQDIRSQPSQSSFMSENSDGPVVTIKVKWQPHPLNEAGQTSVWGFRMRRNHTFQQVFDEIADLAHVLSDNLIVNFGGKRVFASTTPNSLKMWAEGELEACDQTTDKYIRAHRDKRQRSPSVSQEDEANSTDARSSEEPEAEPTGGDTFKLVLRSAVTTKDITLTVRSTTTCGAIVKAFLKVAKLADKYPGTSSSKKGKKGTAEPMLEIDGDRMSPTAPIGDADLDDGDMVEVVGL